jgi:hypothetical protein
MAGQSAIPGEPQEADAGSPSTVWTPGIRPGRADGLLTVKGATGEHMTASSFSAFS